MVAESGRSPVPGSGCQPTASTASADATAFSQSGIPNAGRSTFRRVWAALFAEGHRTLAFEFAREVGLDDLDDCWNLHDGGPCPVNGSTIIKAVKWAEGGIHSWGVPCRADDFSDEQWARITAFQHFSRDDYLAAQAIEARKRQDRETGLGPEGESAVP